MVMSKRILVVDDEEQVLFTLQHALMGLGGEYEIVTARDGCEALERVTAMPFDLVITDLRLPGMDGVTLTEAIRTLNPNTAVIWITAYGCREVQAQAARLGVYRCLDKPVEIGEIRKIALEALKTP